MNALRNPKAALQSLDWLVGRRKSAASLAPALAAMDPSVIQGTIALIDKGVTEVTLNDEMVRTKGSGWTPRVVPVNKGNFTLIRAALEAELHRRETESSEPAIEEGDLACAAA